MIFNDDELNDYCNVFVYIHRSSYCDSLPVLPPVSIRGGWIQTCALGLYSYILYPEQSKLYGSSTLRAPNSRHNLSAVPFGPLTFPLRFGFSTACLIRASILRRQLEASTGNLTSEVQPHESSVTSEVQPHESSVTSRSNHGHRPGGDRYLFLRFHVQPTAPRTINHSFHQ